MALRSYAERGVAEKILDLSKEFDQGHHENRRMKGVMIKDQKYGECQDSIGVNNSQSRQFLSTTTIHQMQTLNASKVEKARSRSLLMNH